jgi:hypothetical protein
MNETSAHFELMEPTSPEALIRDAWVEPWMLVVGLVLAALVAAAIIRHRRKAKPIPQEAIRDAARNCALSALSQLIPVHARDAAVQTSLILRSYLSSVAADPALFETHEETLARHEALQGFSQEAKAAAKLGFSRLAALKYSPELPSADTATVIDEARALLETLHQGFKS